MIVDFTKLELNKRSPIYSQMVRFIKMEIVSGNIDSGDEMPSRRIVSTILGVNPNTVQKAYKLLEEEELLISYAGSKSIVTFNEQQGIKIRDELIFHETMSYIQAVRGMGITLTHAKGILNDLWKNELKGEDNSEKL